MLDSNSIMFNALVSSHDVTGALTIYLVAVTL